jgi:hypothetical protein
MDKTQPETQKPSDNVADEAPKVESSEKPTEETTKPTVTADDEGTKQQADEPVAPSTSTPQESSNDENKTDKQETEDEAKPADEPASEEKASKEPAAEAKPSFLTKKPELSQLFDHLPSILEKTGHPEMWGVTLKDSNDPPTANVLIKFLRANEGNAKLAEEQLTKALEWRKKMDPLSIADAARFSKTKFGGLGYVTTYNASKEVFTWNIYGAVKDINGTFGDVDEYVPSVLAS